MTQTVFLKKHWSSETTCPMPPSGGLQSFLTEFLFIYLFLPHLNGTKLGDFWWHLLYEHQKERKNHGDD